MGDNLVPNGLSRGCGVFCSRSKYPGSQGMKLASQMPWSTSLMSRLWPASTVEMLVLKRICTQPRCKLAIRRAGLLRAKIELFGRLFPGVALQIQSARFRRDTEFEEIWSYSIAKGSFRT